MAVLSSGRQLLRRGLITLGLWGRLRAPLYRLYSALLLHLTRLGLHDPSAFRPRPRDPLHPLREMEKEAQAAATASALLRVLDPLVLNGSALAEPSLVRMKAFRMPRDVALHVEGLERRLAYIRGLPDLEEILADHTRLADFYRPDGYQLLPHRHARKLVVVFTTVYNNFGVSNAVLYAMLRRFRCSVLLLKDPTVFAYCCGVQGLGDDLAQLARKVAEQARGIGCDEIFCMGFSSGGYPSLLFSSLLDCEGYLGFSVHTGSGRRGDRLPRRPVFTPAQNHVIDRNVSPQFQVNLRAVFEGRNDECPRTLVVGSRDSVDAAHARDVAQCPGFRIVTLENCAHDTVSAAIERRLMDGLLADLLRA